MGAFASRKDNYTFEYATLTAEESGDTHLVDPLVVSVAGKGAKAERSEEGGRTSMSSINGSFSETTTLTSPLQRAMSSKKVVPVCHATKNTPRSSASGAAAVGGKKKSIRGNSHSEPAVQMGDAVDGLASTGGKKKRSPSADHRGAQARERFKRVARATKAVHALESSPSKGQKRTRVERPNTTSQVGWISTDLIIGPASDMRRFECKLVVGTGLMGTIRLAKIKADGKYCALKCVRKDYVTKHNAVRHLTREKETLAMLEHPFVIDFFGTFQQPRWLVFVVEFVPGGELFRRLTKTKGFSPDSAKFYAAEVFSALEYIHSKGLVFRDLKPENILIDEFGHVKLCDFGFCTSPGKDGKCRSNVGTPCYLSPEQLNSHRTDGYQACLVDWWAFGCLVYELVCGRTPFESTEGRHTGDESRYEIYLRVLKGKITWPVQAPSALKAVVSQLLNPKVDKRLFGADKVKRCAWLEGVAWERVLKRELRPPWSPELQGAGDCSHFAEHSDTLDKDIDVASIDNSLFLGF